MMAHYNSFVLFLRTRGGDNRPLREFDHFREGQRSSSTVLIPFNMEYAIGMKVLDNIRRRVNVYIDGTMVAEDLVIRQGENILERFLDVDKPFKFVRLSNGGVADPSSKENGVIEVRVWKEKQRPVPPRRIYRSDDNLRMTKGGGPTKGAGPQSYGAPGATRDGDFRLSASTDSCYLGDVSRGIVGGDGLGFVNYSRETPISESACRGIGFGDPIAPLVGITQSSVGEAGATVQGAHATGQTFGSTSWYGDENPNPDVFFLYLRGKEGGSDQPTSRKIVLCPYCDTPNTGDARYCKGCGTQIVLGVQV